MYQQFNSQFANLSKQFADSALKVNSLALGNFEKVMGLQLKAFEDRMHAAVAFMSEAAEARDFEDAKAIWPKGVNLIKESTEQFYAVGQEVFGTSLKAGEEIGQIMKSQFEAANEAAREDFERAAQAANENVAQATRAAKKAAK